MTNQLIAEKHLNRVVNLAYLQNYSVIELLELIERFLDKKLDLVLQKKGSGYEISIPETEEYFRKNQLTSKEDYFLNILKKYYS